MASLWVPVREWRALLWEGLLAFGLPSAKVQGWVCRYYPLASSFMINGHVPGSVWRKYRKNNSCVLRDLKLVGRRPRREGPPACLCLAVAHLAALREGPGMCIRTTGTWGREVWALKGRACSSRPGSLCIIASDIRPSDHSNSESLDVSNL